MSTKTKQRLSQLLFRRSNNASNASASPPANSSSSSQTHHKPQVMGCGNNKNAYEEFAKEESTPSLSSYMETSEGDESRVLQPQKLVAFSDKHLLRARSSSPNKQRAPPDAKPVSILKNGSGHSPQTKNNRGRRNALGKATLQRTKSNPIPQQNKPAIDANSNAIESEASCPAAASNPLLDLSWNCPTLEKRKELILSYFKNYVLDPEGKQQQQQQQQSQSNTTDPIYEEINDNTRNHKREDSSVGNSNPPPTSSKTDSLKPKLLPKKVRLNIPVQVDTDQNYPPIYDKLRPTRSFNIYDTLRGKNKSSSDETATSSSAVTAIPPNNRRNGDSAESNSKSGANKLNNTITANNSAEGIILKDGLAGGGVGLAHFASEVAQHATSRRANRSNSFTPSSLSLSSSVNDGKSSHNNNLLSPSSASEPMDQIYSQLTKRGKKVGSVTSRLLKRHNNNHLLYNHEHGDNGDECITVYGATEHKPTKMDDGCLSGGLSEEANSKNKRTINVGGNYEECDDSYEYSSQEDESESHKVEKSCANLEPLPVRPLRKGRGNAATHNQSHTRSSPILNNIQQPKEKELPEKDLKALSSRNNQTGFINLADVFPPISVIDSTSPQPRAYPLIQFKDSGYAANSGNSFTHTNKDIDRNNCKNHWKDISQKKDAIETSVKVKEEKDQFNISTETHLLSEGSGTDDSLSSQQQNRRDNRSNSSIMDLQIDQETSLASSTEVIKEVDSEPLLVLWEDQKSVVVTQKSPQEDLLLLGDSSSETSTTSDLYLSDSVSSSGGSNCGGDEASIITIIRTISPTAPATVETSDETEVKMTAMNDSNEEMRNQFIRQESKHYYDDEDDGGFESFQVVGNEYDEDDGVGDVGVEDGPFSPPSSSGSPDNMIGRPRTFAQSQQNVPQTELAQKASSVLDLINAEISDLHMRELELKKKNRVADGKEIIEDDMMGEAERSSQADSDDYTDSAVDIAESYSRTSASSGNVTPNDGVRMERDVSPHSEKGQDEEIFEDMSGSKMGIAVMTTEDETVATKQAQQGVKVRPIVEEEEVKSIALNITKETPIEREIRAVREREEEFRRSRGVSSSSLVVDNSSVSSPPPTGEKISIEPPQKEEEVKVSVTSTVTAVNPSGTSGSKDIQYEMAAARLKREIEEGLKRERELYEEGRLKTLRSDEVKGDSQPGEAGEASPPPQGAAFTPFKTLVKIPKKPTIPKGDVDPLSVPFGGVPSSGVQSNGSPAGKTGFSFAPAPAATTMSLSIPEEPVQIQQSPQQTQSLPMNKITKPQFTSIEKMILKGSFSFNRSMSEDEKRSSQMEETVRMNKVARMPDPLQIVQRVESIEEIEEGGASQSETDKPRRKYVTAQDKIQMELQEQVKREKELSQLRAKWKSTPDLSKMDEENGVEKEDITDASEETDGADEYLPTKPSALRRQRQLSQSTQKIDEVTTSDVLKMNKPTVRRRQSALINQWEEMIKQQQEKNKN